MATLLPAPNRTGAPIVELQEEESNSLHLPRPGAIERLRPGLELLLDASHYAVDTHAPVEEFAVEVPALFLRGVLRVDLLWLRRCGYLLPLPGSAGDLSAGSVHLTCVGVTAIREFLNNFPPQLLSSTALLPIWDPDRRELRWADVIVKRFRVPAPNQELILTTFQEEGWPPHIDDPLPQAPGVEPKRRLHDTIVALNRNQAEARLRFLGDGRGLGVSWSRESDSI